MVFGKTHGTAAVAVIVQAAVQWVMVTDDWSGVVRWRWENSGVLVRVWVECWVGQGVRRCPQQGRGGREWG